MFIDSSNFPYSISDYFPMASPSNACLSQELERTKKLLTATQEKLELQSREIAALMIANEAKDAELEHLQAELQSEKLL